MSEDNRPHFKVTLKPSGDVVEVPEGKNLLECLRAENVYIKSSCGGHATCSDCIIKVVAGEDYITPPPFNELKLLGNVFHITKERLACQTCVTGGDITIDITKHDKATDEEKLRSKTQNFSKQKAFKTKVRNKDEVAKVRSDKMAERDELDRAQKEKEETWKKHWEKDVPGATKKLQGGKRPKFFDTDDVDYGKKDFTRPLPSNKRKEKEFDKKDEPATDSAFPKSDKDFKKFRG